MKPFRFIRSFAIAIAIILSVPALAQNTDAIFELIANGELEKAQQALDSVTGSNAESGDILFANALIADKQKQSKKAISLYLELIDSHPEMMGPYNNLAIHYASTGDYESATKTLERALSSNKTIGTTFGNLQAIYARRASLAYRKALNSDAPLKPLNLATIETSPASDTPLAQSTLVASAQNFIEKSISEAANDTSSQSNTQASVTSSGVETTESANIEIVAEGTISATTTQDVKEPAVKAIEVETKVVEVEPVSAPVKISEEAKRIAESSAAEKQALIDHVKSWAKAWSDRDVDRYLSHYSDEFKPRDNMGLEEWKKQRYGRLRWREFIIVKPSRYSIDLRNDLATVNFSQYYKSERFEDTIRKTLELRKENGKWRILREFI